MDYTIKKYEILTKKNIDENRIVTISDLNWDTNTSLNEMKDLLVNINDVLPKYVFILGNICTYNTLNDVAFNEKLTYFFELLSCITKTFIVFGDNDYRISNEKKKYLQDIEPLLNYYKKAIPYYINNYITSDLELNIVGFNKKHLNYNNIDEARSELLHLLKTLKNNLNKEKFNILITHYQLNHLKLEEQLLETFDLILTGANTKTIKKNFFRKEKEDDSIYEDKTCIKTGGVSKGEIGLIKIKKI